MGLLNSSREREWEREYGRGEGAADDRQARQMTSKLKIRAHSVGVNIKDMPVAHFVLQLIFTISGPHSSLEQDPG